MRSISLVALAALSCATESLAADVLRPKYYFPRDVNRRTNTTSSSTSSGTSNEVVVPIYVYVGGDGQTTTVTGTPQTKTITDPVTTASPTSVAAGAVTAAAAAATDSTTSSSPDLLGGLGSDLGKLLDPSTTPAVGSTTGLPTSVVQPTVPNAASITATVTSGSASATSTSTSSDGNLVSDLLGSSGILGGLSPSSTAPSRGPGITVGLSSIYSSAVIPTATSASSSSASASSSNPSDGHLPSFLSSLLPIGPSSTDTSTSTSASATATGSSSVTISSQSSGSTGLPSLSIPISIPSLTLTSSTAVIPPASSSPAIPTATSSSPSSSGAVTSKVPVPSTSASATASESSSAPLSSGSATVSSSTAVHSETQTTAEPSATASSTSSTSATSTQTTQYIPPPVQTPTETSTGTTASSSSGPTQIPGAISPPGGTPETPENSTLVQFGFNKALSWETVATSDNWADQIYYYTPIGVAYALNDATSEIVNYWLGSYDTKATLGYDTTLIKFFIPADQLDTLNALRLLPSSNLYKQPNTPNDAPTYDQESIVNLFSMLNTDIPLVAQQPAGTTPSSTSSTTGSGNTTGGNDDSGSNPGDGSAGTSNNVRASSVGIGVGAAAGAAAYAGVMFYVARRYRKRKQLHARSPSVTTASMSEVGGASMFAQGARISHNSGRSGRTAMISAPVMSENSLGWN